MRVVVGDDELVILRSTTRVEVEVATGPRVCRYDRTRSGWVWRHWSPREVCGWQRLRAPLTHAN